MGLRTNTKSSISSARRNATRYHSASASGLQAMIDVSERDHGISHCPGIDCAVGASAPPESVSHSGRHIDMITTTDGGRTPAVVFTSEKSCSHVDATDGTFFIASYLFRL